MKIFSPPLYDKMDKLLKVNTSNLDKASPGNKIILTIDCYSNKSSQTNSDGARKDNLHFFMQVILLYYEKIFLWRS